MKGKTWDSVVRWLPRLVAIAFAIASIVTDNYKVKVWTLAAVVAYILADWFDPERRARSKRVKEALAEAEKLEKEIPRLWEEALRTKTPEAAEAELLERIAKSRARMAEAHRDLKEG